MAKTMAAKTRKQKGSFKLYLIRHGISCANLARNLSGPLAADLYTDPELTQEGVKRARALRPYLKKVIRSPFVVGASSLMRTQQTAQLLLNPERLYIIPYVAEMGRHSQESTALDPHLQAELLPTSLTKIRDYVYSNEASEVAEDKQLEAFLKWLGAHMRSITSNGRKSLVIVSHYGFIQSVLQSLIGTEIRDIHNCELVEFDVSFQNKVAVLKNPYVIPYMPKKIRDWEIKEVAKGHGCRLSVKMQRQTRKRKRT